jgi:hypothetical protein
MNDKENQPKHDSPKTSEHEQWERGLRACHANMHMTPMEYSFWTVMREISANHKYVLDRMPIRKLAAFFDNTNWSMHERGKRATGINVPGEVRQSLIIRGWLVPTTETVQFEQRAYKVLSHNEWAATHPDACDLTLSVANDRVTNPPLQKSKKGCPTAKLGDNTFSIMSRRKR